MKLNTGQAWNEASNLIASNRELVVVVAGVFFFIPLLVMFLVLFGADFEFGGGGGEPNPDLIAQQLNALLLQYWGVILLVSLGQVCGAIALLGLLGDRGKPTVREVLSTIPQLILTMIAAQILSAIITQGLPVIAGALPAAVAGIVNFLLLPVTIYLGVKLSLAAAVIVIGKERNPINALRQSWGLTKGNSFRIFIFYFLIALAAIVLGVILFLIVGLIFAAIGERAQLIGNSVFLAGIISAYYALSYAVLTAIHRQVSGSPDTDVTETFE